MTTDGGLSGSLLDLSNRIFPPSIVLAGAEQTDGKLAIRGHEPFHPGISIEIPVKEWYGEAFCAE
jgi:hypothetical protein